MNDEKKKSKGTGKKDDKSEVFHLGGREFRKEDKFTPEEFDSFLQQLMGKSEGPVSIEDVDESTGITVKSSVDKWSDIEQGPQKSEKQFHSFREELVQKGYLAFDADPDDVLRYHTKFRALNSRYFEEFDQFVRCQDIPDSYFTSVVPGKSWFVSHRWMTPNHPDPNRSQFQIISEFICRHEVDGIWYDYSCMPQEPHSHTDEALFKDSLKHLNSLIITTNFLSIESDDYLTRAWCHYERIICELLCTCKRGLIRPRDTEDLSHDFVNDLVIKGIVPTLKVGKSSDLPIINDLLETGVEMFKMLAISTTFKVLNTFGFNFGIGTASRFLHDIDFEKFWTIWQILAGSSGASGIQLPHLIHADRLQKILLLRNEVHGTHARFFADLKNRIEQTLDMRIVEQESMARLTTLLNEVSRSGPVQDAYTKLALIQLVYWFAGRDQSSGAAKKQNAEKKSKLTKPHPLISCEVLVIFALDITSPEVDDDWFEGAFVGLISELQSKRFLTGSWEVLRVPDMRIEVSKTAGGGMGLPGPLLNELQNWDKVQSKPNSISIIKITEFKEINGYAFVICAKDD